MRTADQRLLNAVQRPEVYREVVIDSGGTRIVLSVWDGPGDGPALVFLPGTMTHPLFYEEFLDALNRAGCCVVGLHGQGHGKSPRSRLPLTFHTLLDNARDTVTWTGQAFPGGPLAVIGSSQGGVLAMALAAADHRIDAVFAHNILDTTLPSSIEITRFPHRLATAYSMLIGAVRGAARLAPRLPIPFDAYLDIRRVCRDPDNAKYFYTDPLGRRSYPLAFMASLLTADLSGMRDGSITCPVTVIAAHDDPLFPLHYTRQVYDRITAPSKELLVIESGHHLLFNEDLDAVLPPLLDRLRSVRTSAST